MDSCVVGHVLFTGNATLSVKSAAKPLQIETWLLLTPYKKSPAPYLIVQLRTQYDLPFSHNTYMTDRWRMDDKRQPSHSCSTSKTDSE